jgi:hypothetical protein
VKTSFPAIKDKKMRLLKKRRPEKWVETGILFLISLLKQGFLNWYKFFILLKIF